jgi:dihydrofolate reductase
MKNISIIVAIAKNNAIGMKNQLLCHLPDDLKRFKRITSGHQVIMGKRTFESLPNGPLPNRSNIVISDNSADRFEGCTTVYSIDEALEFCGETESFIIGGGMVYRQFFPLANKLYLTVMEAELEADTYFPEINSNDWNEVLHEKHPSDEKHEYPFTWMDLVRKLGNGKQ